MQDERRRYTRIQLDIAATLAQNGAVCHSHVIDISLNGVLVETPKTYSLSATSAVDLSIILSEDIEIQMKVELAHSSSAFLGFHCTSIDMESMAHLRRMIELNIDAPNAAERVLDELIHS